VRHATETMVRMGELAVSRTPGDVLVSIGLGSCIGLALVDARRGLAGLAHIMLPEDAGVRPSDGLLAKYATRAVPALIEQVCAVGAFRHRLEAVLVGGAQMFSMSGAGSGLDIGIRNEEATRRALERENVPIRSADTAGTRGRTIRVHISPLMVTSREVGGTEVRLYS
jgi:chemotaxis protein CheD